MGGKGGACGRGWRVGGMGMKIMQFMSMTYFYLSSKMVVL